MSPIFVSNYNFLPAFSFAFMSFMLIKSYPKFIFIGWEKMESELYLDKMGIGCRSDKNLMLIGRDWTKV